MGNACCDKRNTATLENKNNTVKEDKPMSTYDFTASPDKKTPTKNWKLTKVEIKALKKEYDDGEYAMEGFLNKKQMQKIFKDC